LSPKHLSACALTAAAYNRARPNLLKAKVPAFAKAFAGRWRIVEMDLWGTMTCSTSLKKRI
jgi:hypothetical protein